MKIDIIVPYVDENDEAWKSDYDRYRAEEIASGKQYENNQQAFAKERVRDWNSFRYFFRAVEKNCPWCNKVFLVVQRESQLPEWLNRDNPKLRIVYHDEFIPKEFLPTFSTLVIETFYSRIKDLSEYFIVCNDDFFFLNSINENTFFKDGRIIQGTSGFRKDDWTCGNPEWESIIRNNNMFLKLNVIQKEDVKEYYHYSHLPDGRVKSFEEEFLKRFKKEIYEPMLVSRFRHPRNLIPSLLFIDVMKYTGYSILSDELYKNSAYVAVSSRTDMSRYRDCDMVCFNDTASVDDFELCRHNLLTFFREKFPEKSSFELDDIKMRVVFGLPSWLPDRQPDRELRVERLNRTFEQIHKTFGDVEWLIIAQNWKDYSVPDFIDRYRIVRRPALGILKARKLLQEEFFKDGYDYIVMLDDDVIIDKTDDFTKEYFFDELKKNPDGFMFLQYEAAQLNLCAISRFIYREPMVDIDPQKDEGFEDVIYANLLHYRYPDKEFHIRGIKCIQFQHPTETAPSTWANNSHHDFGMMNKVSMYHINHFKKGKFTIDKYKASMYYKTLKYVEEARWNQWISKEDAEALLKRYD